MQTNVRVFIVIFRQTHEKFSWTQVSGEFQLGIDQKFQKIARSVFFQFFLQQNTNFFLNSMIFFLKLKVSGNQLTSLRKNDQKTSELMCDNKMCDLYLHTWI